ncbi:ATPase, T2SS/T4P/T4SS family (plasmid) [Escherichia coli]|uniref:GspE/PulE family protein n=1 Tax=Enterobacteriaceae TaxID=543 RepID=UPI0009730186|nr:MULTISPECIES: ATPase, T2SS/T4P/T4SS family [Enterobacteriaceae]MDS1455424.1 ATPase, T2SS/T4P/T4SS family [Escherichia coli]MDS1461109.1 ATPase, T2SS/T4P/T4SS family [Escherichia coli]SIZ57722.1 type II secretion protein [Shigella sonnei]SJF75020.1 type II secretion protein [Shigella sonnei]
MNTEMVPFSKKMFSEPSEDDIERFFQQKNLIITKQGGDIEANSEQRRVCLMYSNGDLLVSPDAISSPSVNFLKELCNRKGYKVKKIYGVELKLIRLLYDIAEKDLKKKYKNDTLPMEKIVSNLLTECSYMKVSDLHIKVYEHEADIQIRRNGDLRLLKQIDATVAHSILSTLYNAADEADATYRIHAYQAARIIASTSRISIPDTVQAIRLQYNPLGQGGRYLIARFLYTQKSYKDVIDPLSLGFHPLQCRQLSFLRSLPIGVNIVSGPTGSGKSTTLKILLELLYKEKNKKVNIISIEDPPEYEIDGTAQLPITNVDSEAERGIEYRKAIVAALRSDPDVIMPGEARDSEVINLVFTAAMTGHQVWTSLHANSALAIFDRLKDQGVDDFKLTDPELITGLLAQRLLKKLCPHCSIPFAHYFQGGSLTPNIENIIQGHENSIKFVNESGCEHCSHGYAGRTVVAEIIIPDEHFLSLVVNGERATASKYWKDKLNGLSMQEHAWLKVISGEIDINDAVEKFSNLSSLTEERKQQLIKSN